MPSVCLYFQVHQPHRLRKYHYWDIGHSDLYFDDAGNRMILEKVANKCYLPCNQLLLQLIQQYQGQFKVAFSISGTAIEQFRRFYPSVLDSFRDLVRTGCVELLNETYHHSLSAVFSPSTFMREVELHREIIRKEFDYDAVSFRNTELIYSNDVAAMIASLGYQTVLAEGADKVLKHRSPNYLYQTPHSNVCLLLKNYILSDDIAFRFSNHHWNEYPLTADKFAHWLHLSESEADNINLFMDYETFGEHQWSHSGIFEFLKQLPGKILTQSSFDFCLPHEVASRYSSREILDIPEFYSWADTERDLTAWTGNKMQQDALQNIYQLEQSVLNTKDSALYATWSALLTSDHFYYMSTKSDADGDVHRYFSPYGDPYEAYINYQHVVKDFSSRLN